MIDLWQTLRDLQELGRHAESAAHKDDVVLMALYLGMMVGEIDKALKLEPKQ